MAEYAEVPERVKANRRRNRRIERIVKILVAVCIAIAAVCVGLIIYYGATEGAVEGLSDKFVEPVSNEDENGSEIASEITTDSPEPDWEGVEEETGTPACMWVQVDDTGISYPVAQWSDNEYGLHHDIYGNYSWAGVFLDCDADAHGSNLLIYAHTTANRSGMFSPISTAARSSSSFSSIGEVHVCIPGEGWTGYTPIMALDVDPSYGDIRRFDFEPSEFELFDAYNAYLEPHARAGDYNVVVGEGASGSTQASSNVRVVSSADELADEPAIQVTPTRWYVLNDEERAAAKRSASDVQLREWLRGLQGDASIVAGGADAEIAKARRVTVLACCSWPFDNHRTLLVCVSDR